MGRSQLWFFVLATALIVSEAVEDQDIQSVLEKLPEDDRIPFVRHHVQIGHELVNVDNKGNIQITEKHKYDMPEEFSIALYEMARKNHSIVNDYLLSLLGTIICFPSGECIDIGDVGVHPKNPRH